jgi:hypothetical protein
LTCDDLVQLKNPIVNSPSPHHDHLNKHILLTILSNIKQNDYPIHFLKIRSHTNIIRNDMVENLAKCGCLQPIRQPNDNFIHTYHPLFCASYKMTIYFFIPYLKYTYTPSSHSYWPNHPWNVPSTPPTPQMVQQLKPWSNNIQWLLDPHNSFNNTNNTSNLFLKCPIHGELLETSLLTYLFPIPNVQIMWTPSHPCGHMVTHTILMSTSSTPWSIHKLT